MTARRAPAPPPDIQGFEHVQLLGSGGFSDVFLYSQERPRRRVAVKVLLHDLAGSDARERFDHEANLMAQLSTHPSIVTIYEAGVATDGRPYLAMEYCSRPSLGSTYRRDPLSVAEALRIGIQVAGAVETAHRAGILHRDIKPANILVTEYHRPALTDFGISATTDGAQADAEGMSIPWSPPESFAEPPRSSVASDVWALGATIYSLLAGRSPFEVPGGRNGAVDLISRIERVPVPPTGRSDVPASLERVLATAMAKDPLARYPSALALARAWQQVQVELSHAMTPVDVLDDSAGVVPEEDDDEPGTRVRRIVSIDPSAAPEEPGGGSTGSTGPTNPGPTLPGATLHRAPVTEAPVAGLPVTGAPDDDGEHTVLRGAPRDVPAFVAEEAEATVLRAPGAGSGAATSEAATGGAAAHDSTTHPGADPRLGAAGPAGPPSDTPARRRWPAILVGVALLAVAGVIAAVALSGGAPAPQAQAPTPTASPVDPLESVVPVPADLFGALDDDVATFTWTNPDPQDGDSYLWRTVTVLETGELERLAEPTVEVPALGGEQVCIEVTLRRDSGRTSQPVRGCTS